MERLSVDRLRADEKLIQLVKGYPCLWATQSKSFRDLAAKETAWKIVSTEVGDEWICVARMVSKGNITLARSATLMKTASRGGRL